MPRTLAAILAAAVAVAVLAAAGDAVAARRQPRWEGTFGLGPGKPLDNSIFQVPGEESTPTGVAFYFSGRVGVDAHWAVGVRLSGLLTTTSSRYYFPSFPTEPDTAQFDLTFMQAHLEGRYTFMRGRWQPYAFVTAGNSSTSGSVDVWYTTSGSGLSVSLGTGISFVPQKGIVVGAETQIVTGTAEWDVPPVPDSEGKDLNPGYAALHLFLEGRWGEVK